MEELVKTLPQHSSSWLKHKVTLYKYQGFWNVPEFLQGVILAQKHFKPKPNDILLCTSPKSGTTWLKALAFAIVTRHKFDESSSPLLTSLPHDCVPLLEQDLQRIQQNSNFPLLATHLPYASLPETVVASSDNDDDDCKIVYLYRNVKDVVVSYWHFTRDAVNVDVQDASLQEAVDEFCEGISWYGPYWDHILGYWKASVEKPRKILFFKYEDMKRDTRNMVKRLAKFMGYSFSDEEENAGVVENIIKLCSFENLKNLEVNRSGKHRPELERPMENRLYFRKAKEDDWKNYLTDEMKSKIDKLVDEKLSGTSLILK